MMMGGPDDIRAGSAFVLLYHGVLLNYRVSLKKGSFGIPAPMEALGCSKGLDISQKHCQSSFFG